MSRLANYWRIKFEWVPFTWNFIANYLYVSPIAEKTYSPTLRVQVSLNMWHLTCQIIGKTDQFIGKTCQFIDQLNVTYTMCTNTSKYVELPKILVRHAKLLASSLCHIQTSHKLKCLCTFNSPLNWRVSPIIWWIQYCIFNLHKHFKAHINY